MLNLNNFILEKLNINSKSKIHNDYNLSEKIQNKISDKLCQYFQSSCYYKGKRYDNKLEIIDKFYNNDICKFFDDLDMWDDIYHYIDSYVDTNLKKISNEIFKKYIQDNKKQLYQEIKDFVL